MKSKVGVVVPCFKVTRHILQVIESIGDDVDNIYVVDDACPDGTGDLVEQQCADARVRLIRNPTNLGVGGAVMRGYQAAIEDDMDVIVKLDGDGQMDPALLPEFVGPIIAGEADYTKGNRFFDLEQISTMPRTRLLGNAALSFLTKLSSGYWDVFDPTNGYTAIHRDVARHLPWHRISQRYFFETDMLFRLNTVGAVVIDIPMDAKYGDEVSNLNPGKVFLEFLGKHSVNLAKRIFYNYYLRGMSIASLELPTGLGLLLFGTLYGAYNWHYYSAASAPTPTGTIMIAVISILTGFQLLLAFLTTDMGSVPRRVVHKRLAKRIRHPVNTGQQSPDKPDGHNRTS